MNCPKQFLLLVADPGLEPDFKLLIINVYFLIKMKLVSQWYHKRAL